MRTAGVCGVCGREEVRLGSASRRLIGLYDAWRGYCFVHTSGSSTVTVYGLYSALTCC